MPRNRGGAPRRPAAAPPRPKAAPTPQQARPASTAAHPGAMTAGRQQQTQVQPKQSASQAPGLFGQMASTAAGVAVGSTIGHALGGFFGGGSAPAETQTNAVETQDPSAAYGGNSAYQQAPVCQQDVLKFRQCMDQNQGDLMTCGWYLDQLKACQQAASQY